MSYNKFCCWFVNVEAVHQTTPKCCGKDFLFFFTYGNNKFIWNLMISVIVCALAVWIASKGNWNKIPLSVATVVLIIGVAIWMLASPDDYNGSTDICSMIAMDCPRKIEEFYEAYKDVRTPLGSGYLVQFYTMRQPAPYSAQQMFLQKNRIFHLSTKNNI